MTSTPHPLCFVLMPFGQKPDGQGGIVDFDAVYAQILKPAIEAAGLEPLRSGKIYFAGRDVADFECHEICNLGIGQVAEGRQLFPNLSALENLEMGAMLARARAQRRQTLNEVFELFPRLAAPGKEVLGALSGPVQ